MSVDSDFSAKQRQKILRQRALILAQEPEGSISDEVMIEVVEFMLADEVYAIESSYVAEVYPIKDFTPVPCTPVFVFGLVNLRGKIISVIDMRRFFDLPDKGLSDLNKIIVLKDETMEFGILADSILTVRLLKVSQILPALPTLTEVRSEYLKGVTPDLVVVLDGSKLLTDRKLLVHEEAQSVSRLG